MKRIRHPKLLLAAVLALAVAVSAGFAWRSGWLEGEEIDSIYWDGSRGWSFRLEEDSPLVYQLCSDSAALREAWGLPAGGSPTEADLGPAVGTAAFCDNPLIAGSTVYACAALPGNVRLRIADYEPFGYCFFTCAELRAPEVALWQGPAAVFETWGLPDADATCTVSGGSEPLELDAAAQRQLIDLACGLQNVGGGVLDGAKKQLAYDVLGAAPEVEDSRYRARADALCQAGLRTVTFETAQGFRLELAYYPALRGLALADGFYFVSEAEAGILHGLLYRAEELSELPETVLERKETK